MQKTQLTILIEFIDSELKEFERLSEGKEETYTMKATKIVARSIKNKAIALLPKEKEDMESIAEEGANMEYRPPVCTMEELFDRHFTQYKP